MEENIFVGDSPHIGYCLFNKNTKEIYYAITILIWYKNTKSPKISGGCIISILQSSILNLQSCVEGEGT